MNKFLLFFLFCYAFFSQAQEVIILDPNFEQALIDLGHDSVLDGTVQASTVALIDSLDVSNKNISNLTGINSFTNLVKLDCSYNSLSELNLSQNLAIDFVICNDNLLKVLNLRNGNAENQEQIIADNNPFLTCISVNDVSTANYYLPYHNSGMPPSWRKDEIANFAQTCSTSTLTYVPGDIFEQYLINNGYDDVLDDYVLTTNIESIEVLDLSGVDFGEVRGIEDFIGLESLTLEGIWQINLSQLAKLKFLSLTAEDLNSIDISNNAQLEYLNLITPDLWTLDLSMNSNLKTLTVMSNHIDGLNLSMNTQLSHLDLQTQNLDILDLKNGANSNLEYLNVIGSEYFSCIQVDNVGQAEAKTNWTKPETVIYSEDCNSIVRRTYMPDDDFEAQFDNDIDDYVLTAKIETVKNLTITYAGTDFTGIEDFRDLESISKVLDIGASGAIETLDLSKNLKLKQIYLEIYGPDTIDVSKNTELEALYLDYSSLRELDISNNPKLKILRVPGSFSELDLSGNPELVNVHLTSDNLQFVNLKNGANDSLDQLRIYDYGSSSSVCVQVDEVVYAQSQEDWDIGNGYYSTNCSGNEGLTYMPDDEFEKLFDDVLDDFVMTSRIDTIKTLDLSPTLATDLTGIQDFRDLENLTHHGSAFPGNEALEVLDVSNNLMLKSLVIYRNRVGSIDLTNNVELEYLRLGSGARVRNLDLSNNLKLQTLDLDDDVEQFKSIDLSEHKELTSLVLRLEGLEFVNIQNGTNNILDRFSVSNYGNSSNPACIQVDNVQYAEAQENWIISDEAKYSFDCLAETFVPDDNFEQVLIDLGYDDILNDYVKTSNIESITTLNLDERNISDLTGIEAFLELTELRVSRNKLNNLNISENIKLKELQAYENRLSNLDISNNIELSHLYFDRNNITTIDFSRNTKLEIISGTYNQLTEIDVSENLLLERLAIDNNDIEILDISNNSVLFDLNATYTKLVEVDASQNPDLYFFILNNNDLLEKVSIKNGGNSDGMNSTLRWVYLYDNPLLTCIEVDDAENIPTFYPGTGGWAKDDTATYSDNCFNSENHRTYVPDDNFEQALISLGYDDFLDDYVDTDNIENIQNLTVFGKNISDLTGIEAFKELIDLMVSSNNLQTIKLSENTKLEYLSAYDNNIIELDISHNTALISLNINNNSLQNINLSNNTQLLTFEGNYNQLTEIDLSTNKLLRNLSVSHNSLGVLDISNNTSLGYLMASDNQIVELDASKNASLEVLFMSSNALEKFNIKNGNNTRLSSFHLVHNPLLRCIEVDDAERLPPSYIESSAWTKDETAFYSEDCDEALEEELDTDEDSDAAENENEEDDTTGDSDDEESDEGGDNSEEGNSDENEEEGSEENSEDDSEENEEGSDTSDNEDDQNSQDSNEEEDSTNNDTSEEEDQNETGNGSEEDTESTATDGEADVEEPEIDAFSLYPTISSGNIMLSNNKRQHVQGISLTSLNGKTIRVLPMRTENKDIELDFEGITEGIYVLRIQLESGEAELIKIIIR